MHQTVVNQVPITDRHVSPLTDERSGAHGTDASHGSPNQQAARQQYRGLTNRLQKLLADPLRRPGTNAYLTSLIREVLAHATAVHQYLKGDSIKHNEQTDADAAIEARLTLAHRLLDRYQTQQRILEQIREHALNLNSLVEEMPLERPPKYAHLVALARSISSQTESASSFESFFAQPGLPVAESLAGDLPARYPSVYINAVQTAQTVDWMISQIPGANDFREQVMIAALLQDVGFLAFRRNVRACRLVCRDLRRCLYCRHPQYSAAMIGRFPQPLVAVGHLVARHHERLDGSGFPYRISGVQLSEPLRALTAAVECVALSRTAMATENFVEQPADGWATVSRNLSSLSAQQKLDERWTSPVAAEVQSIAERLASEQPRLEFNRSSLEQTESNHALHPQHSELPNPHAIQPSSQFTESISSNSDLLTDSTDSVRS